LEIRRRAYQPRDVSTTPRDITKSESVDLEQTKLEETIIRTKHPSEGSRVARTNPTSPGRFPDPLRNLRKGKINPRPQSKKQLKKARQAKHREEVQKERLEEIRKQIIHNLGKE
jgi:hypothetical protein